MKLWTWAIAQPWRLMVVTVLVTLLAVASVHVALRTYRAVVLLHETAAKQQADSQRLDQVIGYLNAQIEGRGK